MGKLIHNKSFTGEVFSTTNYLSFDGVDDYISNIDKNLLSTNYLNFEVQVFIRNSSVTKDIFFIEESTPWLRGSVTTNNKYVMTLTTDGNTKDLLTADNTVNLNEWVKVNYIYDGSFMRIFENDIELVSFAKSGSWSYTSDPFNIGRRPIASSGYFDGKIRDFKVYSGNSNNLILHYDFSDGSGTTLTDVSGNNNDGTIVGATWGQE